MLIYAVIKEFENNYAELKNSDKIEHILYDSICKYSRKFKPKLSTRVEINSCLGIGAVEGCDYKEPQ